MKDRVQKAFVQPQEDDIDFGALAPAIPQAGRPNGRDRNPERAPGSAPQDEDQLWNEALQEAAKEAALDAEWKALGTATVPNLGYASAITVVTDYRPGQEPVEITVFAPQPDWTVDVDLRAAANGRATEIVIDGRLRAVLAGVTPYEVDPTDLMIEYAG